MIWEYLEALIWAGVVALVLTTFVVQAFKIPSGSMLETLQIGDHLLVNKFLYGLKRPFSDEYLIRGSDPEVGDVIVFRYPEDPSLDYIKRVVGVPGDVLQMRDKVLYRNGAAVNEPYVRLSQPDVIPPRRDNWGRSPCRRTSTSCLATTGTTRRIRASGAMWTARPFAARRGSSTGRHAGCPISGLGGSARSFAEILFFNEVMK